MIIRSCRRIPRPTFMGRALASAGYASPDGRRFCAGPYLRSNEEHAIKTRFCSTRVRMQLEDKLSKVFGPRWNSKKFAIRSSAVGEDSEEMSAAGQMTTYLGVKGEEEVYLAVVKCWASQFAPTGMPILRTDRSRGPHQQQIPNSATFFDFSRQL